MTFDDTQSFKTENIKTAFERLEILRIPIGPLAGGGGAVTAVGDYVLFATPKGKIGFLRHGSDGQSYELRYTDARVPMNFPELQASELWKNSLFGKGLFRTLDMLPLPRADGRFDLYVSHHRFAGKCFEFVVSRVVLEAAPTDIKIDNGSWEDVFVAKPCIELKHTGLPFAGHQAGGRLAKGPDNTLLVSIGDFEFDGINAPDAAPMDPRSDLGKLISVNLDTKEATIFASGLRNPQGLFVSSDGVIWETEHGPDGGDEVNLLRRGENYGWPAVSYGLPYRRHQGWEQDDAIARHEGFAKPAFAFVPSIGISSLLEVEGNVPLWRGDLIVTSLKDMALWRLRLDGQRIVYSERIPLGDRLRDVQELPDGDLALLTDSGKILIVRHAPLEQKNKHREVVVSGFGAIKKLFADAPEGEGETGVASGKDLFDFYCAACHSLSPTNTVGPTLSGVVGRKIGSVEGYAYSDALQKADGVWTEDRMTDFLAWSQDKFPGTTMPSINMPFNNYKAIAAYLKQAGGAYAPSSEAK